MSSPAPLDLWLKASPTAILLAAGIHVAGAICLLPLRLDPWLTASLGLALLVSAWNSIVVVRGGRPDSIVGVRCCEDSFSLQRRDGVMVSARLESAVVLALAVVMKFRDPSSRCHFVAVLPDSTRPAQLRRLRVFLKLLAPDRDDTVAG